MDENCQPVEVEAINFLNAIPHISFTEDDHSKPGDRTKIEAITHQYIRISEEEYRAAYRRAIAGKFERYLPR